MIRNGRSIGEYTFEQVAEDYRVVHYNGEDQVWTKKYNNEYLVYEEHQYGPAISKTMSAFEYEADGTMILKKHASPAFEDSPASYAIGEYIYQDGKLSKEIWYSCESPSIEDFFNGNYTKNENDILDQLQYTESEVQIGDERVVTVRKYDSKDNTLIGKTISTYDTIYNRIIRKIQLYKGTESIVEETIYQY